MFGRKVILICAAASMLIANTSNVEADGWRFWKKKNSPKSEVPPAKPNQQSNKALEKQLRDKQKKQAQEKKKQREEFIKALKKKEREMLRRQRDAQRKFQKTQRSRQRRLQRLLQQNQGKSSWRFWKRSNASDSFFLPK